MGYSTVTTRLNLGPECYYRRLVVESSALGYTMHTLVLVVPVVTANDRVCGDAVPVHRSRCPAGTGITTGLPLADGKIQPATDGNHQKFLVQMVCLATRMVEEPTVYVTRNIPSIGIEMLKQECRVEVWEGKLPPEKEQICDRLEELRADGLMCMLTDKIDGMVMDSSSDLDAVSTYSVGFDHIDLDAAETRDIAVGHTPGVLTDTTADYAWALLMASARRTTEGDEYVREGRWETWQPRLLTGRDVSGSTLGIVGLGNIGAAVAKRSAGFDMEVLYSDVERHEDEEQRLRNAGVDITCVNQEEVFERSDFVTLHVPLFPATEGLVGEEQLELMKENAILVNTSRGPVVDIEALESALRDGQIERAALDVTDPEPIPGDHSLLELGPEKVLTTPHIASASVQTRDKMAKMAAENLLAGIRNEPLPNSAFEKDV